MRIGLHTFSASPTTNNTFSPRRKPTLLTQLLTPDNIPRPPIRDYTQYTSHLISRGHDVTEQSGDLVVRLLHNDHTARRRYIGEVFVLREIWMLWDHDVWVFVTRLMLGVHEENSANWSYDARC